MTQQEKPSNTLFATGVMPSRAGGLIIFDKAGTQLRVHESEVDSFIERVQVVRSLQLKARPKGVK